MKTKPTENNYHSKLLFDVVPGPINMPRIGEGKKKEKKKSEPFSGWCSRCRRRPGLSLGYDVLYPSEIGMEKGAGAGGQGIWRGVKDSKRM